MNNKIRSIVTASLLAAVTTLAPMVIKVPTFGTNGYVNIGDAAVLISASFAAGLKLSCAGWIMVYALYSSLNPE